ncbi:MAG TPA: helix-hairpin-helix domain-containing protein [Saprospiraceae bacterium]|nr:helix-hairpin-helix domain-containing protein [Saprospiraceae bacterium]
MLKKAYSTTQSVCKVTFSLPVEAAPDAEKVVLVGDFNNWNTQEAPVLKKSKNQFETSLELAAGRSYEFRYLIDNKRWENDWEADDYTPSPFTGITNSVLVLDAVEVTPAAPAKKAAAPKKASTAQPVAAEVPAEKPAPKAKAVKVAKPAAPASVVKDDLTKIEGIGPKIAEIFATKGIATFADLSKAKPATLKTILDEAGSRFKMHDPTTWPAQAKLVAAGSWEKLQTMQDELKGGKK